MDSTPTIKTLVCTYSVLRFSPYRETEEFVNVGIALSCASTGFADYRVEKKRRRISNFFPELDIDIYRSSLASAKETLDATMSTLANASSSGSRVFSHVFREIVAPKEGIIYFGDTRVISAKDPAQCLNDLFAMYVDRQFAKSGEYQETVMRRQVEGLLKEHNLLQRYTKDLRLGNDIFKVSLPLVHVIDGRARKAIKPLDLDKKEPSDILHHGDAWSANIRRLKEFSVAPDEILFLVRAPNDSNPNRWEAFRRVAQDFAHLQISVMAESQTAEILKFAHVG